MVISESQKIVLELLTKEFLTVKEIAKRRQTSRQAIHKTITKLRKKGLLNRYLGGVDKGVSTTSTPYISDGTFIRLHGLEIKVEILEKKERYNKRLKEFNIVRIKGNTIRLFKNSIEIYIKSHFTAQTVEQATAKGLDYINNLFIIIENDLGITIIKDRKQNIKLVNAHYSECNNELAKEMNKEKEKIKLYAREDGKLWFTIDNSFNLNEAETLHPASSKEDMQEAVKPFFDSLRDNKGYTPSFVLYSLGTITEQFSYYGDNMRAHVDAIKLLSTGIKELRREIGRLKKKIDQTKLGEWL